MLRKENTQINTKTKMLTEIQNKKKIKKRCCLLMASRKRFLPMLVPLVPQPK